MSRVDLSRLARSFFLALFTLTCGHLAQAEGLASGLAVVDYDRLLLESEPGRKSLAPLEALIDQKKKEGQAMEMELQGIRGKAAEQATTASEKQLEAYQRQFNDKLEALRRFQTEANKELDQLRADALGGFSKLALPVIQALGKERGHSMIMQKQKLGLMYLDPSADITDLVIQRLNGQTPDKR